MLPPFRLDPSIFVKLNSGPDRRPAHLFLLSYFQVTMSISFAVAASQYVSDPKYGSVYRILTRPYIGSWGDANAEYSRIRRKDIATELRSILSTPPSQDNIARCEELLKELRTVESDISTQADAAKTIAATESTIATWAAPVKAAPAPVKTPVKTAKTTTAPPAPKKPKVVNTFAALAEDSDEDNE